MVLSYLAFEADRVHYDALFVLAAVLGLFDDAGVIH